MKTRKYLLPIGISLVASLTVFTATSPSIAQDVARIRTEIRQELHKLGLIDSPGGSNAAALGPSSSTDNAIARYDGTTGKLIQDSAVTIDDTTGTTKLPSAAQVKWSTDAGLKRSAAGDVRATDGSTGVGTFSASAFNATDGTAAQASLINSSGGRVKVGSGGSMQWSSTTAAGGSPDTAIVRPEAKAVQPTDASTGAGYFYLGEVASAPTGTANVAKLYAADNGAGKTQLVVIFGSGAAQVIATEP